MKRLVTSELGLHPLTLQDFDYMQKAYMEGFSQLVKTLVGDTKCILWGMEELQPTQIGIPPFSTWRMGLSEGAYWDGNEILYHQVSHVFSSLPMSPIMYVYVAENQNVLPPVLYRNGVLKNVYTERYAWSGMNPNTGTAYNAIPRMEDILKAKLGVNTLTTDIQNLNNSIETLSIGISELRATKLEAHAVASGVRILGTGHINVDTSQLATPTSWLYLTLPHNAVPSSFFINGKSWYNVRATYSLELFNCVVNVDDYEIRVESRGNPRLTFALRFKNASTKGWVGYLNYILYAGN